MQSHWPARLAPLLSLLLSCTGASSLEVQLTESAWPGLEALPVERREVTVEPGLAATVEATTVHEAPVGLALLEGRVVAGTAEGLLVASDDGSPQLSPVVLDAALGVGVGGPVRALAPRQGGGLLVAMGDSFLHDYRGRFYVSPLTGQVPFESVHALDASGFNDAEVVWLTLADRALSISASLRASVVLEGHAAPTFAAGAPDGKALLAVEGDLYQAQVSPARALRLLEDVGAVHAAARRDGSLFLATDAGLVERTPAGPLRVTSFREADGNALPVRALAVGAGALHLLAGDRLLALRDGAFVHLGDAPAAEGPRTLAVDARGHAWVGGAGGLVRVRTGDSVTFAQVSPFLQAHCASCHAGAGTDGAPGLPLTDYEGAVLHRDRILARLADPQSPMPPRRVEVLLPEDWSIVARWVDGGMKP
ncbi:MAG: hypothetical protein L0Y66_05730 [Myxococcaceae bacterium]|nr:hypothetical protein [Myxococcaceae bacterium]